MSPTLFISNPHTALFMPTLITGTCMAWMGTNWIYMWVGLELNTLSFIGIIQHNMRTQTTEAATKYFITQSAASVMFLMGGLMNYFQELTYTIAPMIITISTLMKMGAAPFHFWYTSVLSALNWEGVFLVSTWQKLAPLALFLFTMNWVTPYNAMLLAALNTTIGGTGGLGQTQVRPLIAYSSISHMGWMIALGIYNTVATLTYFTAYMLIMLPLLMIITKNDLTKIMNKKTGTAMNQFSLMALILCSLGGVPPLAGFSLKWGATQILLPFTNPLFIIVMFMGSLCNMFFYLNMLFSTMIIKMSHTKQNYNNSAYLLSWPILFMLIMSSAIMFIL